MQSFFKSQSSIVVASLVLMLYSSVSHAALHDRGGGLIYDDVLNVTWLQDANYAKTSGYDSDGKMNWYAAMAWSQGLSYYDQARGIYLDDWRLPTTYPQTEGFYQNSSELGHLFYVDLGNQAGQLINTSPFVLNTSTDDGLVFWSSTDGYLSNNQGWHHYAFTFILSTGEQDTTDPNYFERYAWALRDGDVAPIPEPETYGMLLSGLGIIGFMARRRKI